MAIELDGESSQPPDRRGTFLRLMRYWVRYWKFAVVVFACIVASSVFQVLPGLYIKKIIDVALPSKNARMLLVLALAIVGVTALSGLFSFFQRFLGEMVAQRVIYRLRKEVYESLQNQSFSFFDRTHTGQVMSRTTMDVDLVRRFLSFGLRALVGTLTDFSVVLFVCIVVLKAPGLTLLAFSTGPAIVYLMIRFSDRLREPLERSRETFANLSSVLQENLAGIHVVSAFNQEESALRNFQDQTRRYFDLSVLLAKIRALYGPSTSLLVSLSMIAILFYGTYGITKGFLTLGTLMAFNVYVMRLVGPLRILGNMVRIYRDAVVGAARVFEIIDAEPDVRDAPDAIELEDVKGRVTFENVSFSYGKGPPSLKDVSFDVSPGETVVLLGATGSGKSTIVNLVPRFYDPTSGAVKIDGIDVRKVRLKSLRRFIGIVPQETFLFSTTIRENIAYGKPDATMEEIQRVAKLAEADEFIRSLPNGYDTVVGERGVTLSGGEKQRIAIARALLMDPRILILDDSTSSVDTETEYEIQKALDRLLKNRTTFIITQRLSMIRRGHRIIVMDGGKIAEQGTHEELLKKGGIYARIYHAQATHSLEAGVMGNGA